MKTKRKKKLGRRTLHKATTASAKLPFIEHLYELRKRLYCIVISVVLCGAAIYSIQQQVVSLLLKPARGQHFIYTTPGGGIDFLFRVCLYSGFVLSLPLIVYNILRFIEPIISNTSRRFIFLWSFASGILALIGIVFGYFIGLPAALHFLLHQFTTVQIQPLVTIQSYLGFVIVYMVGSAMLFQLPLLLLFINRIKPLPPKRLLHYERWVVLAAFVLAGLMNPTPNILSQLLVAGPFILTYQASILLITLINRPKRSDRVWELMEQDKIVYAKRQSLAMSSMPLPTPPKPIVQPTMQREVLPRPRQRFMDFIPSPTPHIAPKA